MITPGSDSRYALLGARAVGEEALNRFYVLHCIAIPLVAALLMSLHFWRVRKDGGISGCLLYTSPSPRDGLLSRMPSSA